MYTAAFRLALLLSPLLSPARWLCVCYKAWFVVVTAAGLMPVDAVRLFRAKDPLSAAAVVLNYIHYAYSNAVVIAK